LPSNHRHKIDILLPVKERFTQQNAGAISGVVNDLVTASTYGNNLSIFGYLVAQPLNSKNFIGLRPKAPWLHGNNIAFALAYLAHLKKTKLPDLVEVHNRGQIAKFIAKNRPDLRVSLYLHNDPRDMLGTKTETQRLKLLSNLAGVVCVSDYIKNCYLDGLTLSDSLLAKIQVARNGTNRWIRNKPKKKPVILIAGRVVPQKGTLEAVTALSRLLPNHPSWTLIVAGAKRFEAAKRDRYEQKVFDLMEPLGSQAKMLGFIPANEVRKLQALSAISACPSLWDDPMPKSVIESLAAGCALLTTRRGGIPEVAEGRALIIDDPSIENFYTGFSKLIADDNYRVSLQSKTWEDFPFTAKLMAESADLCRLRAIEANPGQ